MSANNKKGASEARAAMAELVSELDRTRKEYAKATLQLTHLETTVQHLKDAEMKKDQVIAHLESELARREASFGEELAILQEEVRSKETAFAHRTKFLEMEIQRLKQEVEVANSFERENRQLRDTVLENQATIEKLQIINEELRARAKDDVRDHAAQLEVEFKKRLAESEKKFRAEAYRALSEEAKIALQGNDHLQTVLQRQNDSIEAVLLKCKTLEQAHSKIAGEQEISGQNLQHHVAEIQRLKKQLADTKGRNTQLEETLRQRKVERASLELLYIEYENGRKQLTKEKERCRRAIREAERWRNRSVQLTHELTGEQREAAEAKLVAVSTHNATMEAHAVKSRLREERTDRARQKNASGAQMLRQVGGATPDPGQDDPDADRWSQVSSDDEDAVDDETLLGGKGNTMNPMDILAMWNSNFESYGAGASNVMSGEVPEEIEDRDGGADGGPVDPDTEDVPRMIAPAQQKPTPSHVPDGHGVSPRSTRVLYMRSEDGSEGGTGARGPGLSGSLDGSSTSRMNVARPPPRVDDQRKVRDQALSVLSLPRQPTLPAPARHFAVQQTTQMLKRQERQSAAPVLMSNELRVISHGQLKTKTASGSGASASRFITP
jgi:hypothetical protein